MNNPDLNRYMIVITEKPFRGKTKNRILEEIFDSEYEANRAAEEIQSKLEPWIERKWTRVMSTA